MKIVFVIPALIILLFSEFSFSQDTDSTKSKWSGEVTFTGLYLSGNTNKFLVQGKGSVKKTSRILETILMLSGSYGENKGSKDDNSYYGALTVDLYYEDIFSPFLLHMNIGFVAMYQPVVNYFSKANFYIEGNVEVPLTKMFRLNSIYTYTFDNVVSVGRKRADNKLTFGAGFFF